MRSAHLTLISIFVLIFSACQTAAPPSPTPTPQPTLPPTPWYQPQDSLVKIRYQGGLCQYGGCWRETLIFHDGSYQITDGSGETQEGTLETGPIDELRQTVETTVYQDLRVTPFTDTCPTAYDGSEIIYTFYTPHGEEVISSCEFVIDEAAPVFQILFSILTEIQA